MNTFQTIDYSGTDSQNISNQQTATTYGGAECRNDSYMLTFNKTQTGVLLPASKDLKNMAAQQFSLSFWIYFQDNAGFQTPTLTILSLFNQIEIIIKNNSVSNPYVTMNLLMVNTFI